MSENLSSVGCTVASCCCGHGWYSHDLPRGSCAKCPDYRCAAPHEATTCNGPSGEEKP